MLGETSENVRRILDGSPQNPKRIFAVLGESFGVPPQNLYEIPVEPSEDPGRMFGESLENLLKNPWRFFGAIGCDLLDLWIWQSQLH